MTVIDGPHSAQCRILDDKLADPIMTGDKVFTPLWSPGQQNHFALSGIMNLDGDGHNQIGVVRGLINESGGVVDCWLDEQGEKHGQITSETTFLVLGDPPDKSSEKFRKSHTEILDDVTRYHVQTLKLAEFKQQMNYQKSSSVEHFGSSVSSSNVGRASTPAPEDVGSSRRYALSRPFLPEGTTRGGMPSRGRQRLGAAGKCLDRPRVGMSAQRRGPQQTCLPAAGCDCPLAVTL